LWVCKYLTDNGFSYAINEPFNGTIVPRHFYEKNKKVQSIMIEVNKRLYLTDDYQKSSRFDEIKGHIDTILDNIEEFTLS